jgi:hypothetical protein
MRWLNRLGVTGAIDAGSVFQNYPKDYELILKLSGRRIADDPARVQPFHAEAHS